MSCLSKYPYFLSFLNRLTQTVLTQIRLLLEGTVSSWSALFAIWSVSYDASVHVS